MESIFRGHPLWAGATEEEIDNAVEVIFLVYEDILS